MEARALTCISEKVSLTEFKEALIKSIFGTTFNDIFGDDVYVTDIDEKNKCLVVSLTSGEKFRVLYQKV